MGMTGTYDARFSCDYCNRPKSFDVQSRPVQTPEDARKEFRDAGWRFLSDGTIKCPDCVSEGTQTPVAEGTRNGAPWTCYGRGKYGGG